MSRKSTWTTGPNGDHRYRAWLPFSFFDHKPCPPSEIEGSLTSSFSGFFPYCPFEGCQRHDTPATMTVFVIPPNQSFPISEQEAPARDFISGPSEAQRDSGRPLPHGCGSMHPSKRSRPPALRPLKPQKGPCHYLLQSARYSRVSPPW